MNLKFTIFFVTCFFLSLLFSSTIQAELTDRVCTVLNYACSVNSSHSGQASPSAGDSIGNNPAFIPVDETPFGIEVLSGEGTTDFNVFQGYGMFGLAAGAVAKKHSFFSNASNLAAVDISLPGGTGDDINRKNYSLAFSLPLFKKFFKKGLGFVPHLGLGMRQYRESGNFRESYGFMLASNYIHMGVGFSKNFANISVFNLNSGFRIKGVLFDYTFIRNLKGVPNKTHIISTIISYKLLSLILAYRKQEIQQFSEEDKEIILRDGKNFRREHYFAGLQIQFKKILTFGVYYNYLLERDPFVGLRIALGSY
ncbi:MAG: hypothetical protein HQK49_07840 [Oligoflexia bacterium]|nr:hypothetical protein [Oligoflexia bacterium]